MAAKQDLFTSFGLLIFRVSIGGMMAKHGFDKLMAFGEKSADFPDPLGIGNAVSLSAAIGAELFCSALVILGLFTPVAAIPVAFTMLVALFLIHADDPWQKKELAAVYLACFTSLIFTGGGRFALYPLFKSLFSRKKKKDAKE